MVDTYFISEPSIFGKQNLFATTMASSSTNGNSVDSQRDEFNHHLAIKLSRALNINPNDLLAQRVSELAKQHTLEGFTNGTPINIFYPIHLLI
jgi:hypothetical protein